MSIVVYRDGVMASDSGCFAGSAITGSMTKVVRTKHGVLIGTAGRASLCEAFQDWASIQPDFHIGGLNPRFRPDGCEADGGRLSAIVVRPNGSVITYHEQGFPTTLVKDDFVAFGLPEDIAIGAMMAGADAFRAVEICISRHVYAVGPVQVAHLSDHEQWMHERGARHGFGLQHAPHGNAPLGVI